MKNEVQVTGVLVLQPQVGETATGKEKIVFALMVKGIYDSFPVRVYVFQNLSFVLRPHLSSWKVGDTIEVVDGGPRSSTPGACGVGVDVAEDVAAD